MDEKTCRPARPQQAQVLGRVSWDVYLHSLSFLTQTAVNVCLLCLLRFSLGVLSEIFLYGAETTPPSVQRPISDRKRWKSKMHWYPVTYRTWRCLHVLRRFRSPEDGQSHLPQSLFYKRG